MESLFTYVILPILIAIILSWVLLERTAAGRRFFIISHAILILASSTSLLYEFVILNPHNQSYSGLLTAALSGIIAVINLLIALFWALFRKE